jgi:serine/threonine protein phosphatase PrpC
VDLMQCAACSARLFADDRFCEACGSPALAIVAAVSEQGRTHHRNEDAVELRETADGVVAVVCDGISTSSSGHLAAAAAARAVAGVLGAALSDDRDLVDATCAGAMAAREAVARVPWTARLEPACTLVCATCRGGEIVVGWIGDSRAYWLADGDARGLTVDDSWATEQVAAGTLSPAEVAADRRAHALTHWVGADAPDDGPHTLRFRPAGRGRLLLCSDGLWNYAPDARELGAIVGALASAATPATVARHLTDLAMERGGRDDITVAVIDVNPSGRAAP